MKTIKDFMLEHAGMFDMEEPDPGHMDRMMSRLNSIHATGKISTRIFLLRIAAILVLGVIVSYLALKEFRVIDNQLNSMAAGISNRELNEAEQFYTSQLNIYYGRIRKLGFNNDAAEKKQVLEELSAMDEQVQVMKHDLKQNPDDERIVHAIINFYQVKIEMMDVIIARAQQPNNTIL